MTDQCDHLDSVQADLVPSSDGCEDCLAIGGRWVHLRMCQQCGHVIWRQQTFNHGRRHDSTLHADVTLPWEP